MDQEKLSEILRLHDLWLEGKPDGINANLDGANLDGANLNGADLRVASLEGANLEGANLGGANLGGANLGGANLRSADLRGANLIGADLRGADLRGASLLWANLRDANLKGADTRGANFDFSSGIPFHCGGTKIKGGNRLLSQMIYHMTRQDWEVNDELQEFLDSIPKEVLNSFCKYRVDLEDM